MIDISHKQARHLLRIAKDHRLPHEQWSTLEAHLENCAECRLYRDQLDVIEKDLRRTLRAGWETVPGPAETTPRQVIVGIQQRQNRRKQILRGSMMLAALVLIVWVGQGLINGSLKKLVPISGGGAASDLAAEDSPSPTAAAADATPLPTAKAGDFPAVVAYEARAGNRADGKKQIYLFNSGSDPVALFDGSANDSDPAWSPDGQWIAFLSDRTGKPELFVTALAGNKVVQVTNQPGVTWEGPLSWSADGQWIALAGVRDNQAGQRWIYVAALDGTGARALTGTRGGSAPEFSPLGDRLAYTFSDEGRSGVSIYHLETGEKTTAYWNENPAGMPPATGSALDWSADGQGLAYIAAGGAGSTTGVVIPALASVTGWQGMRRQTGEGVGSQILAARVLNTSITNALDLANNLHVAQSIWPGAFRGVGWTPNGSLLYLQDLSDARAQDQPGGNTDGCWTLQARFVRLGGAVLNNSSRSGQGSPPPSRPVMVNNLCVEGGLDRTSWTPDGRWIVVVGRMPGDQRRSLFAVRLPEGGFRGSLLARPTPTATPTATPNPIVAQTADPDSSSAAAQGAILRLADVTWPGSLPHARPRLAPGRAPLQIDPQPVARLRIGLPPSDLSHRPDGPEGQIVYVVQNNAMSVVVRSNPDGTGGQVVSATEGQNVCPRFSADGKSIALVARNGTYPGLPALPRGDSNGPINNFQNPADEIYVISANGGTARQISLMAAITRTGPAPITTLYSCPIWSPEGAPGGPYVASVVNSSPLWFLAILSANDPQQTDSQVSSPVQFYVPIGVPVSGLSPVWSPDGRFIYLVEHLAGRDQPALMRITLPEKPGDRWRMDEISIKQDWTSVLALTMDPTGEGLILLETTPMAARATGGAGARVGAASPVLLRRISFTDAGGGNIQGSPLTPDRLDIQSDVKAGSVRLLYDSRSTIGLVLEGGPLDPMKAVIYRYDLSYGLLRPLARLQDTLYNMAWSPDGQWLIYSTESGLWGLDVARAVQGEVGPVWLSPVPVQGLDWR